MRHVNKLFKEFGNVLSMIIKMAILLPFLHCCSADQGKKYVRLDDQPVIEPDYRGVTIPFNIAPLNFMINEVGKSFDINICSGTGSIISLRSSGKKVIFPLKTWKDLLSINKGQEISIEITSHLKDKSSRVYRPFNIFISNEPVDPYMVYRILYPGYEAWVDMKIVQRSTENFSEVSLFENQLLDNNCVNCHCFMRNNPEKFLLHVRGSRSGTYFVDHDKVTRTSLKTDNMPANAVYPSWHPSGKYVAFSSNKTVQAFHSRPEKNIEVFDLFSSLVLYDVERKEMMSCQGHDSIKYMETFPYWSPDGSYLYYCRTPQVKEGFDFRDVKYDLVRMPFDQYELSFGKVEVLFNAAAINKSVSFPAVSPDGKSVVFTLHDYGTFSIWHREADLYILNTTTLKTKRLPINSDESESYHSWSSNGSWLLFSSKRDDGLSARPYFAYIYSSDSAARPFVLPQKDPGLYGRMKKTFNKPEFTTGRIIVNPRDFAGASVAEPVQAIWTGSREIKGDMTDKRYKNEKY